MTGFRTALLVSAAAALAFATTSLGGSGVGATFNLGTTNSVNASSILTGTPTTATSMLNVKNQSSLGGSFGVLGQLTSSNSSAKSAGVRGIGLGQGAGVYGSSTNGFGVRGVSSTRAGVYGIHTSASYPGNYSAGVVGENTASNFSDYGVYGSSSGGAGVYGTSPSAWGVSGVGVVGVDGYGSYWGVVGRSDGEGVRGAGVSIGVHGESDQRSVVGNQHVATCTGIFAVGGCADNGFGVYATSAHSEGVYGHSSAFGTAGVHGDSADGDGVLGTSTNGPGVYGYSQNGSAAYFEGDVTVSGSLYAGAKHFRIDDPLDPRRRYLQHTSVESPDMKDFYDGIATTDAHGFATVRLPSWFQALNRSFRYQLTSLSGLQQVAVAKEIHGNRFTIQSQRPHARISWQVTGIRHDPYANANRTPVIVPKATADRGKYVYPQAYGKPQSAAIGYRMRR